jgi:hypothetical protein
MENQNRGNRITAQEVCRLLTLHGWILDEQRRTFLESYFKGHGTLQECGEAAGLSPTLNMTMVKGAAVKKLLARHSEIVAWARMVRSAYPVATKTLHGTAT